jgi:hypothetical protein
MNLALVSFKASGTNTIAGDIFWAKLPAGVAKTLVQIFG